MPVEMPMIGKYQRRYPDSLVVLAVNFKNPPVMFTFLPMSWTWIW
jgi:hypothetical protein